MRDCLATSGRALDSLVQDFSARPALRRASSYSACVVGAAAGSSAARVPLPSRAQPPPSSQRISRHGNAPSFSLFGAGAAAGRARRGGADRTRVRFSGSAAAPCAGLARRARAPRADAVYARRAGSWARTEMQQLWRQVRVGPVPRVSPPPLLAAARRGGAPPRARADAPPCPRVQSRCASSRSPTSKRSPPR